MTNCAAGPQAVIVKLGDSCPPANPHLYTEHDVYGREYFHWPAWVSCLAVLPPSSCTPAH